MRRILLIIVLAVVLLAAGCQAPRLPHNGNTPVLMGDVVPCANCEEDVVPVDGRCPVCGQLLPRS